MKLNPVLFRRIDQLLGPIDTTRPGNTTGPSLEDPAMVPTTARDASGLPLNNRTNVVCGDQTGPTDDNPSTSHPSTSRMAYLREKYRDKRLSEEVTTLLLKSRRVKTNKYSYDSLFGKWHGWCDRGVQIRPCADLFTQGYKYNSLNSYT